MSLLGAILAQTTAVRVFAAGRQLAAPAAGRAREGSGDARPAERRPAQSRLGAGGYLDAAHAMGAARLTPGESLAALEEGIAVMRAMWSGERRGIRFDGRHYQLSGVHPGPEPAHPIQVWIGANMPAPALA